MKREILYTMKMPYRQDFLLEGFHFGEGEKSCAVVGGIRGDEVQQMYTCARLVKALAEIEQRGNLLPGHEILVIPCANRFSMNVGKRFWPMDGYRPGCNPPSYDKQYVRDHLETLDWGKAYPGPRLPSEVIARTSAKYQEAYAQLTGHTLAI